MADSVVAILVAEHGSNNQITLGESLSWGGKRRQTSHTKGRRSCGYLSEQSLTVEPRSTGLPHLPFNKGLSSHSSDLSPLNLWVENLQFVCVLQWYWEVSGALDSKQQKLFFTSKPVPLSHNGDL